MQTTQNNLPTKPRVHNDLADFFVQTRIHYPGYIKQAVFRDKLMRIVSQSYRAYFSKQGNTINLEECKKEILTLIDQEEWRPISLQHAAISSKEKRAQAIRYIQNAGEMGIAQVGGKVVTKLKVTKAVTEKGQKVLSKQLAKTKINAKVSDKINKALFTLHDDSAGMLTPSSGTEYVIDSTSSKTTKMVGGKINRTEIEAIEVSFGEGIVGKGMNTLTDFIPVTSTAKLIVNVGSNLYMGGLMLYEAHKTAEMERESMQFEKDLNQKIRQCIHNDFASFGHNDLIDLIKYLGIK